MLKWCRRRAEEQDINYSTIADYKTVILSFQRAPSTSTGRSVIAGSKQQERLLCEREREKAVESQIVILLDDRDIVVMFLSMHGSAEP